MSIASFAIGFVTGWVVRSTVESSRELAVDVAASSQNTMQRLRRLIVAEHEFLEDLWAEAKTRVSAKEPPPEPGRSEVHDADGFRARDEGTRADAEAPS